jgi:hypothetical protein
MDQRIGVRGRLMDESLTPAADGGERGAQRREES